MTAVIHKVDNDISVRCPEDTCFGHLEQGRFDRVPRCDTCFKTFSLLPEVEIEELTRRLKEAEGKLDEIRSIA